MFAVKRRHRLSPNRLHELEDLVAAFAAVFPAISASDHFFLAPAYADAEIDAAARQPVKCREFLRRVDGVSLRHQTDAASQPYPFCSRGEKAEWGAHCENRALLRPPN